MKINRFFEESNFHSWLIDNNITSPSSASSYCTYVNSANNILQFNKELQDIYNYQISKSYTEIIEEVLQVLSEKNYDKRINKAKSTIGNWKSGFRAYGEYLISNFEAENEDLTNDEISNKSLLINYNTSYTKQDLYKIFTFRLITQDRLSGEIYFPISFIKRIFYKTGNKAYLDKWTKKILDNTVIHLENNELKLKQISNLYFDAEGVKTEVKQKLYHVYTKHSNNVDKSPFETKELRKIALDHDKPMLQIMNNLGSELVELQNMTSIINEKLKNRKLNRPELSKISNSLFSDLYLDTVNIDQLKSDMDLIGEHTKLQLMDANINSKKGSK